jgi:hypothetical protein
MLQVKKTKKHGCKMAIVEYEIRLKKHIHTYLTVKGTIQET